LVKTPQIIGWQEWCALPQLELPAVKVKVDTGARTSALHASNIEMFTEDGRDFVRFCVHPLQRDYKFKISCVAPLVDHRFVTSSNGKRERRYVIQTQIQMAEKKFLAEVTLTCRKKMAFRMLMGRQALRNGRFIVNPAKSFLLGKLNNVSELYVTGSSE
tara:strand:+ start:268 stop:744 length:477 start_codon:yes stop_codon:yes gene_type:complete